MEEKEQRLGAGLARIELENINSRGAGNKKERKEKSLVIWGFGITEERAI